jgi:primosomal protein N'
MRHQVKPVAAVISPGVFSPSYWQLLEAVADYYQTPLMQVIRTALPPGLLARSQRRVRLTAYGPRRSKPAPGSVPHSAAGVEPNCSDRPAVTTPGSTSINRCQGPVVP